MDKRITLVRDGIAAASLEGLVAADDYRAVQPRRCAVGRAMVQNAGDAAAPMISELLFGEAFDVLFEQDGFAFGQGRRDGYVGFVALSALGPAGEAPTHRVSALSTLAFSRADIKAPAPMILPQNSLVRVVRHEGRLVEVQGLGFVIEAHLAPIGVFDRDLAGVATGYLSAPYLWGGRTVAGLDCSGLVQQAMTACGRFAPRDSDQQRDAYGEIGFEDLRRGDLVFWPGHVAIMIDGKRIIHANGYHMQTAIEPLAEAVKRIEQPATYRRP
jgi:cell wall-associated NlpC family hydrolase